MIVCFCLFAQASKAIELWELEELDKTNWAAYLLGVMDSMIFTTAVAEARGHTTTFCIADDVVQGVNLAEAAIQTFKNSNSRDDVPVALAVIFGIDRMFPCR